MIAVSAATGLVEAIRAAGADPDQVLRSCGVNRSALSEPDGFIACSDFAGVLDAAAQVSGDDVFGLHFGERSNPKNLGPLTYVVLNSPTIGAGIENVARYIRVHNEAATVSLAIEGRWAYARHVLCDRTIESPRQHDEYSMAVGLNLIRMMVGSQWAPVEVQFAHKAPARTSEHFRVFGAPVVFGGAANAFVMDPEFVRRQIPAADERLYPVLKRYLDLVLSEMPREDHLLASIRRVVAESLRNGDPKLTEVATKLAMSPRTLQRHLKEHGSEFKSLVDDTRRRFSLDYLKDREHTLTDIAYLVGYSEVSAFNRAFKRWTGSTPSEYRRAARGRRHAEGR